MNGKQLWCIVVGLAVPMLTARFGFAGYESTAWLGLGICLGSSVTLLAFRVGPPLPFERVRRSARPYLQPPPLRESPTAPQGLASLRVGRLFRNRRRQARRCHVDRFYLALLRDL